MHIPIWHHSGSLHLCQDFIIGTWFPMVLQAPPWASVSEQLPLHSCSCSNLTIHWRVQPESDELIKKKWDSEQETNEMMSQCKERYKVGWSTGKGEEGRQLTGFNWDTLEREWKKTQGWITANHHPVWINLALIIQSTDWTDCLLESLVHPVTRHLGAWGEGQVNILFILATGL